MCAQRARKQTTAFLLLPLLSSPFPSAVYEHNFMCDKIAWTLAHSYTSLPPSLLLHKWQWWREGELTGHVRTHTTTHTTMTNVHSSHVPFSFVLAPLFHYLGEREGREGGKTLKIEFVSSARRTANVPPPWLFTIFVRKFRIL